ncbi:hypothetical protein TNCV_4176931 [Trichonephila clavipes]|nr:hypothetical protein TNCV_4176931 [Trichonephila clavipes]
MFHLCTFISWYPVQLLLRLPAVPLDLESNLGESMGVYKRIVPLRHGLNSHRAASPFVRLVEEEEKWEASDPYPQGVLALNSGGTESSHLYGTQSCD